jgi:hypothetical protein
MKLDLNPFLLKETVLEAVLVAWFWASPIVVYILICLVYVGTSCYK